MSEVEFNYKGNITIIQCRKDEKMKDIFNKFLSKIQNLDIKTIFFVYSGNANINGEFSFEEVANESDKKRNKMNIIVNDIDNIKNETIIKSKNIICPICKECIKMHIEDYNIFLSECRNGHTIDNILIDEFEDKQKINISKIKCDKCGNNKAETFNNIFYICNECKINLCPICKSNHDKSNKLHNVINYDDKYYICNKHNKEYVFYCNECKKDICMHCENEHNNHELISYGKIMPNIEEIKIKMEELKENINKFKEDIKIMINILNKTMEKIEHYYNINNYVVNNYSNNKLNYEILYNIKNIFNNNVKKNIKNIINKDNINEKFKSINNIFFYISNKIDKMKINYEIDKDNKKVRLFGKNFVKNNKNKCKFIIESKVYELMEEFNIEGLNIINNILEIELKNNILKNTSYMFYDCSSLKSLPDISKWNTNNVTNMSNMFYGCLNIIISKMITKKFK